MSKRQRLLAQAVEVADGIGLDSSNTQNLSGLLPAYTLTPLHTYTLRTVQRVAV